MNSNPLHRSLSQPKVSVFMVACMLYQLAFSFQGLDMSDSGFNAVFYQMIFDHPKSFEYNFMFWLTGVVGGLFYKAFSFLGLWGFRLLGLLINTMSIFLAYRLLVKYIPKLHAMAGLFIVLVTLNNEIKELNYNMLSGLMNLIIITLLYKSVTQKRQLFLFTAAALCSINILIRIPNLLSAGFFLAIWYYQLITHASPRQMINSLLIFLSGWLTGIALNYGMLVSFGHLKFFKYALHIIFNLANDNISGGAASNSYGALTLVKQSIYQTYQSVIHVGFMLAGLVVAYLVSYYSANRSFLMRVIAYCAALLTAFAIVAYFTKDKFGYYILLFLYSGMSLLFSLTWLVRKKDPHARLLAALGIYLVLYYPFGSSFGLVTAGRYSFWIALPIAINLLLQFRGMELNWSIQLQQTVQRIKVTLQEKHARFAIRSFYVFTVISGIYFSYYYPFFDWKDRINMTYGVDNPQLKGIYTTKARATAVNDLLNATSKYAAPGTFLLAYDDIPLVNFATKTVPFINNSMPWLYSAALLEKELKASTIHYKELPVIVKQKVKTFGDGSEWPEKLLPQPYEEWEVNKERNSVLRAFLAEHEYKIVWKSDYFEILIPSKQRF